MDGAYKVAVKQLRIGPGPGIRVRVANVSSSQPLIVSSLPLTSPSASCKRTADMGQGPAPKCPDAHRLPLEQKLRLCPNCISFYAQWHRYSIHPANASQYGIPTRLCELTQRSIPRAPSRPTNHDFTGAGFNIRGGLFTQLRSTNLSWRHKTGNDCPPHFSKEISAHRFVGQRAHQR